MFGKSKLDVYVKTITDGFAQNGEKLVGSVGTEKVNEVDYRVITSVYDTPSYGHKVRHKQNATSPSKTTARTRQYFITLQQRLMPNNSRR